MGFESDFGDVIDVFPTIDVLEDNTDSFDDIDFTLKFNDKTFSIDCKEKIFLPIKFQGSLISTTTIYIMDRFQ
ncbi:hypothetical protein B0H22_1231 [Methanohalophilus euhalobius]|uniref:Uncharacterized protein n=1 Tax=Methanohalophilus euhalobius TaxID=51203 RepID=A0A314ZRZ4_9EURY|nr:hypothetical protein B0H22_1231 [Methanohalophilus euhalobius]